MDRVVVASGKECRTRRRAERCRMETVVPQAFVGQSLKRRRVGWAAKRARLTEANVVEQDREYVGGTRGGRWHRNDIGLGVGIGIADVPVKSMVGKRQNIGDRRRASRFCMLRLLLGLCAIFLAFVVHVHLPDCRAVKKLNRSSSTIM